MQSKCCKMIMVYDAFHHTYYCPRCLKDCTNGGDPKPKSSNYANFLTGPATTKFTSEYIDHSLDEIIDLLANWTNPDGSMRISPSEAKQILEHQFRLVRIDEINTLLALSGSSPGGLHNIELDGTAIEKRIIEINNSEDPEVSTHAA